MRRVVIVLALLIVASVTYGQFRGYEWGTDLATVIEQEGKPYHESEYGLIYVNLVLGSESIVGYTFEDGALVSGKIRMLDADEERVVGALETKYGEGQYGVYMWSENDTSIMLYSEDDNLIVDYWYEPWMEKEVEEMNREEEAQRRQDAEAF